MNYFSIRVELHYATSTDYTGLASNLRRVGIVDSIVSGEGVRYKLPPAEYSIQCSATLKEVHQAAKAAADATGRRNAVVTTRGDAMMWTGLEVA